MFPPALEQVDSNGDDEGGNDGAGGDDEQTFYGSSEEQEGESELRLRKMRNLAQRNDGTISRAPSASAFFRENSQRVKDEPTRGDHRKPNLIPNSINAIKLMGKYSIKPAERKESSVDALIDELLKFKSGSTKSAQPNTRKSRINYDYEDVLAAEDNNDTDVIRKIRSKLLDKFERKFEEKKANSGPNVNIPLQALLLAALATDSKFGADNFDRLPWSRTNRTSLIADERNERLIKETKQDFDDSTADLGNLRQGRPSLEDKLGYENSELREAIKPLNNSKLVNYDDDQTDERPIDTHSRRNLELASETHPQSTYKMPDDKSPRGQPQRTSKTRRESGDDDFDLDQKVEEYAEGLSEHPLQPTWMGNNQRVKNAEASKMGSKSLVADFDEEFGELEEKTRRKLAADRRKALQSKRASGKPTEEDYQASGQKFLNDMERDTSDSIQDVDQTIGNIEESIPSDGEGEESVRRKSKLVNNNPEDDDEGDEGEDDDRGSTKDGIMYEPSGERDSDDLHEEGSPRSTNRSSSPDDKSNAVDEEVRKIEREAKERKRISE